MTKKKTAFDRMIEGKRIGDYKIGELRELRDRLAVKAMTHLRMAALDPDPDTAAAARAAIERLTKIGEKWSDQP